MAYWEAAARRFKYTASVYHSFWWSTFPKDIEIRGMGSLLAVWLLARSSRIPEQGLLARFLYELRSARCPSVAKNEGYEMATRGAIYCRLL